MLYRSGVSHYLTGSVRGSVAQSTVRRAAQTAVLALILLATGWCSPALSGAKQQWSPASVVTPKGQSIYGSAVAVGERGYTVLAWVVVPGKWRVRTNTLLLPIYPRAGRGRVRVKAPGSKRFGRARTFGGRSISNLRVGIARNGQTVMSWTEANGQYRVTHRNPRKGWSRPYAIRGGLARPDPPARLSVGPDGTAMVAGMAPTAKGRQQVLVAVRRPGRRFGRWVRVSGHPDTIWDLPVVAAGTHGRGTVAWSGPCGKNQGAVRWVDLAGARHTKPAVIPDSRCEAPFLQLESDDRGFQYLKGGTSLSIRRPGEPFPPFSPVTSSQPDERPASVGMSLNPAGPMALIWGVYEPNDRWSSDLEMVTYRHGSPLSPVEAVANLQFPEDGLRDFAALPDGSVSTLWFYKRSWRMGRHLLTPGQTFPGPVYRSRRIFPPLSRQGIKATRDGRQLHWWVRRGRNGRTFGFGWSETR